MNDDKTCTVLVMDDLIPDEHVGFMSRMAVSKDV